MVHPLGVGAIVRTGGASGKVGSFGMTRRDAAGNPKAHKGVDWLADLGAPIHAPCPAVVTRAGSELGGGGYGQRLVFRAHEQPLPGLNLWFLCGHMSRQDVGAGEAVVAGQVVGLVGRSGNVSELEPTHLHFEFRVGTEHEPTFLESVPIDPVPFLVTGMMLTLTGGILP